jgi:hypothetical protein
MHAMGDTLHHLMEDVGLEASSAEPPPPATGADPPLPTIPRLLQP